MKYIVNLTDETVLIPVPDSRDVITVNPKWRQPIFEDAMLQWPSVQELLAQKPPKIKIEDVEQEAAAH